MIKQCIEFLSKENIKKNLEVYDSIDYEVFFNFCIMYSFYFLYYVGEGLSIYLGVILKMSYKPFKIVFDYILKRLAWKKKTG